MNNPITTLRLKRAKSRRAPMPVSQKPRGARTEGRGPNPYTPAGTLFYNWFEHAARRKLAGPTEEQRQRRSRTSKTRRFRRTPKAAPFNAAAPAGSREANRRVRQGAHLNQHPSVVARFANHPTRAQIDEQIGAIEKVKRAAKRLVGAAA